METGVVQWLRNIGHSELAKGTFGVASSFSEDAFSFFGIWELYKDHIGIA